MELTNWYLLFGSMSVMFAAIVLLLPSSRPERQNMDGLVPGRLVHAALWFATFGTAWVFFYLAVLVKVDPAPWNLWWPVIISALAGLVTGVVYAEWKDRLETRRNRIITTEWGEDALRAMYGAALALRSSAYCLDDLKVAMDGAAHHVTQFHGAWTDIEDV